MLQDFGTSFHRFASHLDLVVVVFENYNNRGVIKHCLDLSGGSSSCRGRSKRIYRRQFRLQDILAYRLVIISSFLLATSWATCSLAEYLCHVTPLPKLILIPASWAVRCCNDSVNDLLSICTGKEWSSWSLFYAIELWSALNIYPLTAQGITSDVITALLLSRPVHPPFFLKMFFCIIPNIFI